MTLIIVAVIGALLAVMSWMYVAWLDANKTAKTKSESDSNDLKNVATKGKK